jgi:hypothetical protein
MAGSGDAAEDKERWFIESFGVMKSSRPSIRWCRRRVLW